MKLRLYHGSKAGLDGAISPVRGNDATDFGVGFYLGADSHQPQTLICGGPKPVLYTVECDFGGLKTFSFEPGLDWALFVSRTLSAAECEALKVKAENQRTRAIRETKRIRDQYRREGVFFDEILERMAKEGSTCP